MEKKIIIVEDDVITQHLYTCILNKEYPNITYEIISDGALAIKRLLKNHFDLLITDVKLKGSEDIDGLKIARCAYTLGKPVLIITGTDFTDKIKFFFNNIDMVGRIEYMYKPVKLDKFKQKLEKILKLNEIPLNNMFKKIMVL